ncbi:WXG100 family type VII secretion target [Candidatus Epulonipiscium viviparus]|uniref:WXG100 family type VII secretion target n=1 Tax=Candidatus Epulonipiscium viviparus TaxID=420336 RepID=UPI00016C09D6|nr:WXG100 family type VII secretion target [Candidatus Epulopiscium viviparus]
MADLIQVTPSELRERAKDVRTYRTDNDTVLADIAALIRGLNEIWEGEAQRAFEAKFNNVQSKFVTFSEEIEKYAKMMERAADGLEFTDQDLSSKINNYNI